MRSRRVFRLIRNLPRRDLPQMKVKPRKLKVSGLPSPRRLRLSAAKRPNSISRVFSGCSDSANSSNRSRIASRKRRASLSCSKPDDEVVGIAHDDHVARGLAPSPALGPQIEDVVQVDVGKQRRDHRSLRRPPVTDRHVPVFQDARLQPFPDQADHAPVADPMFQEADEPLLAHRVEERSDVGVQYQVHLPAARSRPPAHPSHRARRVRAGTRTRTRGSLPRRSRSAPRPLPVGRSCPPGPRPPAGAAVRPAWVCTPAVTAAPDTLPDGPEHAGPRACARGPARSPATSARPRPARRPP